MSGKRECVRIKDEERREEGDLRVRHGVKMGRGGYCQKGHRRTVIGDRVSDGISERGRSVVETGTLEQGIKEEIESASSSRNREEEGEIERERSCKSEKSQESREG